MKFQNGARLAGASLLAIAFARSAASEPVLAEITTGSSRMDFRPVASFGCLQLTVTGPDVTFEKQFGPETTPRIELPYPATDGSYRWQLARLDQACTEEQAKTAPSVAPPDPFGVTRTTAPAPTAPDDSNGRAAARKGRPERAASGPYQQSGAFRVANGTIVVPSNAPEPGGKK
jgi:hypothetical protein